MQAILLAAGFGTRLKPYSSIKPKPLFPVLNRPLLHVQLEKLQASGCTRIIVNAHHLAAEIEEALLGWPNVRLQYEPEILGTGGSLREALDSLDKDRKFLTAGGVFDDDQIDAFIELKMAETMRYETTPHPVEYDMYYSV